VTGEEIIALSRRMLRPYVIPPECPYLSEDQRELSTLPVRERIRWQGTWLALADRVEERPARRVVRRDGQDD
jgi:hypothetical protein